MPRSKRAIQAAADEGAIPPTSLSPHQHIAQILRPAGSDLYSVRTPSAPEQLVEMPARFRGAIWVKRGSFVVIDTSAFEGRANKLAGEIACVIREEKEWRKMRYWPEEFRKKAEESSDEEEDVRGKMPPSDEDDE